MHEDMQSVFTEKKKSGPPLLPRFINDTGPLLGELQGTVVIKSYQE
jgi:hypothetical protein